MNTNFDIINSQNVYHRGAYKVLCKSSCEEMKKELVFVIEKYSETSHLKIVISDESDPCFLCVLVVTRSDYDELKKLQGLLIDFDSFPSQLVRLLQQCASGNMFLLLHQQGHLNMFLEIIEHNEFKRLVHLSLKTGPASDADIKRNMADNILILKKNISILTSNLSMKESTFQEKEQSFVVKCNELEVTLSKVKDDLLQRKTEYQESLKKERDKLDLERAEWKRCADLCSKTQAISMQDALVRKEKQLEDSSIRCRQLQDTLKSLESQIMDKSQRILTLEKQLHTARTEADTWRNQNGALDRDYHDKEQNLQQTRARLMDTEKTLKDKSDMLKDALDSLQCAKREKASLEERLHKNEHMASQKLLEIQNTSDQLCKANQIIGKMNNDLLELREKLMCRTAIALEQEKVIEHNSREIFTIKQKADQLLEEIEKMKKEHDKLLSEIEITKRLVTEKEEIIKNNNSVIHWLHRKLDNSNQTNDYTAPAHERVPSLFSSTPFVSSRTGSEKSPPQHNIILSSYTPSLSRKSEPNTSSKHNMPNDNDPPQNANTSQSVSQFCINPMYLKPSSHTTKSTVRSKSQDSRPSQGDCLAVNKENRNNNKVPYKNYLPERKLKSTTRNDNDIDSPISAYFPKP